VSNPGAPAYLPSPLHRLNSLPAPQAASEFHRCCGSRRWAEALAAKRPFETAEALYREAEREWFQLAPQDWLEAFSHHPRIGERNLAQPKFEQTAAQSSREQSGMGAATDAQRQDFATLNADYERKFGHVFLICASGKSADHMLAQLRARLGNDAATELQNAAREQNMITRLRLERMLSS
jgi:2-oxo-4-hydroxy-4-carboxy-5-ureidoimidazoline decarboxylase